jgi:repressor LexA
MTDDVLEPLTVRQEQVLEYIYDRVRDRLPPTRVEIARHCGFKSPNAAEEVVKALARKGRIEILPGISRGIKVEM